MQNGRYIRMILLCHPLEDIFVIYGDLCTDTSVDTFFSLELKETIRNGSLFQWERRYEYFYCLNYKPFLYSSLYLTKYKKVEKLLILFYLLLTMEHFSSTSSWNFRNRSWTSASLRKKERKWVKGCFLLKVSRRTSIRVRAEITPLRCWPVITVNKKKKRFNMLKDHQLVVK